MAHRPNPTCQISSQFSPNSFLYVFCISLFPLKAKKVAGERTKEKLTGAGSPTLQGTGSHCLPFSLPFKMRRGVHMKLTEFCQLFYMSLLRLCSILSTPQLFLHNCGRMRLTLLVHLLCVSFSVREDSHCNNHSRCRTITMCLIYRNHDICQ